MNSYLYEGTVRHRRFAPVEHEFQYRLALFYLDLDELPEALPRPFCSARGWAPVVFRREDHLGDPSRPLAECVRDLVAEHATRRPTGPIRMLTHPRYFGYCFNPVSFYYVFEPDGQTLEAIVAEVNNTPWGEQHCYVLQPPTDLDPGQPSTGSTGRLRSHFAKAFHVSPFMDMAMDYDWSFTTPRQQLATHFVNLKDGQRLFDVTMNLRRRPICQRSLAWTLLRFPLATQRVMVAIYWQAFRLWWKRTPFFAHPKHSRTASLPVTKGNSA